MLWRRLVNLWKSLFHSQQLDRDLDAELENYRADLIQAKVRAGKTAEAAEREALIEIGGFTQVKAAVREVRMGSGIAALVHDVRFALRSFIRNPGFATVAVLTFALGIGANAAIFDVVDSVLIRPLPYQDSSQLTFVWSDLTSAGYPRAPLSGPELKDLRDRGSLFSSFGAIWANTLAVTGDREPEQWRIGRVTANYFDTLGVHAQIGRTFNDSDEARGATPSVLLSDPLWRRMYGADPGVVGRKIIANGQPTIVIGVMPENFRLLMPPDASVPEDLEAWAPLGASVTSGPRGQQFLRVLGRMKPGVAFDQARSQVSQIAASLSREFPSYGPSGLVLNLVDLQSDGARSVRPGLLTLSAGVVILLITACMNVAGLLIARAVSRARETALRLAIGASHRQIARQCLVEGLVLAVLGALLGFGFGETAVRVLLAFRPAALTRLSAAGVDLSALAFTAIVAVVWGVLFSFAPMVEVFRTDVAGLMESARHSGPGRYRLRAVLVTLQVAFCLALLVGAGLMIRTFVSIQRLDPGYRSDRMLAFRVNPTAAGVVPQERAVAINEFQKRLQAELAALPGVTGVGAVSHLPFDNIPNWGGDYIADGTDASKPGYADYRAASPGYFQTVDAQLVEGRFFSETDDTRAERVAIVDDLLARKTWPGESALGKQIRVDPASTGNPSTYVKVTIVGVVHHMRLRSFVEELSDQVYLPIRQFRRPSTYVVRTSADPAKLIGPTRSLVRSLDPQLPVYDVHLVEDNMMEARSGQRFTMILAVAFAAIALSITFVGVYGLIGYSVNSRQHEFGIRLAIGAQARQVVQLVLRETLLLLAAGLSLGVCAAAAIAHLMRTQLFGVRASDASTYLAAILVVAVAGLLACWLPARRAALSSPLPLIRSQ